jgi:hypothetical protein
MFGGEDHALDRGLKLSRSAHTRQDSDGPGGASILIVRTAGVVDGIVKPQGDLDCTGIGRQTARLLEVSGALRQMLRRVIGAMRLRVPGEKLVEDLGVGRGKPKV